MAIFNSQLSHFLPREEFFSEAETSLSVCAQNDQKSPSSSSLSGSSGNSPIANHQISISSHSTIEEFKDLIARRTIEGIKSIEELVNWKSHERDCVVDCIFGVIKSVRDSKGTKFKYVTLIDPTNSTGIEFETFGMQDKIAVGQMMKICHFKVQRTGSSVAFIFTTNTKTKFFPLFSYNYENPMGSERNKALTETRFSSPKDREVCFLLEKWFSYKILNGTKLSNLPKPGEFVDICCQVLAFNKNPLCINAIIWDTSKSNHKPLFGPDGRPPTGLESINYDYFPVAYERYFSLTIWKEENHDQAQHYDTFKCIDLTTGDDLVVLFNLQVFEDPNHRGKVSLVMRSSRKWGKAVRLCHPNSILGKMLMQQIENYRSEYRRKLGLLDSMEIDESGTTDSPPSSKSHPWNQESPQQTKSIYEDTVPSTSGYALRSRVVNVAPTIVSNKEAETSKQPDKSTVETPVDTLTGLKIKAKGYPDWDKLISNGLERLKLLDIMVKEQDLHDNLSLLSREEYLQLVQFAINYLVEKESSKDQQTDNSVNDSDESTMVFPVIDRVKFCSS